MSTTLQLGLDPAQKEEKKPAPVVPTDEQIRALGLNHYYFSYWDKEKKAEWYGQVLEKGKPDPPAGIQQMVSKWDWWIITVKVIPNEYYRTVGKDGDCWETALLNGRSYLVGSAVPMDKFIRDHRSPLKAWHKAAYKWARENPLWRLEIETKTHDWYITARGKDYVEFGLPHQDRGGERHYVSNNGFSKVLVNVD